MNRISVSHRTVENFPAVQFNNGVLELALIPELGGKIYGLRDVRTGREWLWRNPRMKYQRVPHGSSYILNADTGGWDECFPSVAPCEYPSLPHMGAMIQDHGELWSQTATLEIIETENKVALHSRWHGVALPYIFERTIFIESNSATLHFEYRVTNSSDVPLHWIWSSHPLIAIEPGMQLLVPDSARFNLGGAFPANLISQTHDLKFPLTANNFDLKTLPQTNAGIAMKLWSMPLAEGWATLRAHDGEFQMRWDVTTLSQLGIWLNLGAWAGDGGAPYYNLGLEPCIGAQDSLADAVTRYHLFETLAARASRNWTLDVELIANMNLQD